MSVAGYKTLISAGSLTSVSVTAEACTSLSATVYRVTSTARRFLDPAQAVVVKDGGVTVSAALWSIDYLTSRITFSGYVVLGSITVDAYYIPLTTVAEVQSAEVVATQALQDITPFDYSNGAKSYKATLLDGSMVLGGTLMPWTDLASDVVGGVSTYFSEGTQRGWRLQFYDGSNYFVASIWGTVKDFKVNTAVDAISKMSLSLEANARSGKAIAFDVW